MRRSAIRSGSLFPGDGSLAIHQDADLYASLLSPGAEVRHTLAEGRHAWLQVVGEKVELNGVELDTGDGAAVCA